MIKPVALLSLSLSLSVQVKRSKEREKEKKCPLLSFEYDYMKEFALY